MRIIRQLPPESRDYYRHNVRQVSFLSGISADTFDVTLKLCEEKFANSLFSALTSVNNDDSYYFNMAEITVEVNDIFAFTCK